MSEGKRAPRWSLRTRRRLVERIALGSCIALLGLALWPLFSVVWELWQRGHGALSWEFLSTTATGALSPGGGIWHAIVGSGMVVGLALLMGAPVGILAGIYLAEIARDRPANILRTVVDALAGIPSIVAGLVAYALVVSVYQFSAYAGAVALAILMLPTVTRTTEEALRTVPTGWREASLALGAPRWRTILTVVLPASISAVVTGLLLATARIAGETAPLLLTVLTSSFLVTQPSEPVATLPVLIYNYGKSAFPKEQAQAWGAALVLILGILAVNLLVRLLSARRRTP